MVHRLRLYPVNLKIVFGREMLSVCNGVLVHIGFKYSQTWIRRPL